MCEVVVSSSRSYDCFSNIWILAMVTQTCAETWSFNALSQQFLENLDYKQATTKTHEREKNAKGSQANIVLTT